MNVMWGWSRASHVLEIGSSPTLHPLISPYYIHRHQEPPPNTMLRTTVLALVATAVNAQNELTEICETHRETYPAARCLDADGNVVAGITSTPRTQRPARPHIAPQQKKKSQHADG